jgi:hypothetical protein
MNTISLYKRQTPVAAFIARYLFDLALFQNNVVFAAHMTTLGFVADQQGDFKIMLFLPRHGLERKTPDDAGKSKPDSPAVRSVDRPQKASVAKQRF